VSVVHVWLSTGTVVAAEAGEVVVVDPPGEGEEAVHPARRMATMQMTENTIAELSIEWNYRL
jgi:hypothetical protein